ncbi:MAG: hypothetical protein V2A54_10575 [Bacteroidota bacterium]
MKIALYIICLTIIISCNPTTKKSENQSRSIYDSITRLEKKKFDSIRSIENAQTYFQRLQAKEDSVKNNIVDTTKAIKKQVIEKNKDVKKVPAKKKIEKPVKKKKVTNH